MLTEEIQKVIEAATARGVNVMLTPDDKILLDGPKIAAREVESEIRRDRAAIVAYLKASPSAPVPSKASGSELNETVVTSEIEISDAPQEQGHRFTHCPKCNEPLFAPPPHIQVESFDRGQHEKSSYYWWSSAQLKRLEDWLAAHPGEVLMLPAWAHSVNIRRPDGSVHTFYRVK